MLKSLQEKLVSLYCPALDDTVSLPTCRECSDHIQDFNCGYRTGRTAKSHQDDFPSRADERKGNSPCCR